MDKFHFCPLSDGQTGNHMFMTLNKITDILSAHFDVSVWLIPVTFKS